MRAIGKLYKPHPLIKDVYQPNNEAVRISRELHLSPYMHIGALAGLMRRRGATGRRRINVKPLSEKPEDVTVRRVASLPIQHTPLPQRLLEGFPIVLVAALLFMFGLMLTASPRSTNSSGGSAAPRIISTTAAHTEEKSDDSSDSSSSDSSSDPSSSNASTQSTDPAVTSSNNTSSSSDSSTGATSGTTSSSSQSSGLLDGLVNGLTSSPPSVTIPNQNLSLDGKQIIDTSPITVTIN